ncbi:MAG: GNAT family N-acetyltransferase [Oscillospiraceae bacterium]|jgi:RimJ/RimL family protein N-acetyltransferase|nr:GNAT family N-acetyltransferase [Oscillospiraceae bacterium]
MKYFRKIVGERVYLSPINQDDAEIYTKWMNDPEVALTLGQYRRTITVAGEQNWIDRFSGEHNYAIVRSEDNTLIGNIGINSIDYVSRTAEVGLIIGEAENRGGGYGTEALGLLVGYLFNTLNTYNVMLYVHADNAQAIACYKKVGFREFGRRSNAVYKEGKYVDQIYMEILNSDKT